jgi:hypothetical protein
MKEERLIDVLGLSGTKLGHQLRLAGVAIAKK